MVMDNRLPPAALYRPATPGSITIAAGQTTSGTYDADGAGMFGFVIPAGFQGTEISFTVSVDGDTFAPLYDTAGVQVTLPVAAGRAYAAPTELAEWPSFRVVSNATEAAERVIQVSAKG